MNALNHADVEGLLLRHQLCLTEPRRSSLIDAHMADHEFAGPSDVTIEPIPGESTGSSDLPPALTWAQRRKSAHPLPGGYSGYVTSLRTILDWVVERQPEREALEQWLVEAFSISAHRSRLMIDFLLDLPLLQVNAGIVSLPAQAQRWRSDPDPSYLVALLHSRVRFIGEMVAVLREPHDTEAVLAIANHDFGMGWQTRAQIDRRRGWLQSAGAVVPDAEGRLVATELGLAVLPRLELYAPGQTPPEAERTEPELTSVTDVAVHPDSTTSATATDDLEDRLRSAATLTSSPAEFERAVTDTFRSLGYEATHLGGPGQTDVLLVADLGPQDSYRVIIDCKTTSHEGVSDAQIDWITLSEHRVKHKATYVSVVGPAFMGPRVRGRARDQGVTLIDVQGLITLHLQHVRVPMGLDTYQELFTRSDADEGAAVVAEAADDFSRWLELGALTLRLVRELETEEGALSARDLYWNIRGREKLGSVTDRDLQLVLDTLANPPLGLLRRTADQRYQSVGPMVTTRARLLALAALLGDPRVGGED